MMIRRIGGYAFPSALGRILLEPDGDKGGGQGAGNGGGGDGAGQADDKGGGQQEGREGDAKGQGEGEEPPDEEPPDEDPPTADQLKAMRAQLERERAERQKESEELKRYREADRTRRDGERQAEREKLRKAGELDKLEAAWKSDIEEANRRADEADERVAQAEQKARNTVARMQVMAEFGKYDLVPGWLDKLMRLHGDEFEAVDHGDDFVVTSKDGKSLASKVAAIMRLPEYRHVQKARVGGGSGANERRGQGDPDAGREEEKQGDHNARLHESWIRQRTTGTLGTLAAVQVPNRN